MRTDVHFAALRAAAKVAFSMALLNGCSSADGTAENSDGEKSATGDGTASSEAAVTSDSADKVGHQSCTELLNSTFPGPDRYQTKPVAEPADVVACCEKQFANHGLGGAHRWACCVAYDPAVDPEGDHTVGSHHGNACTPWGPPVPPSMARRARMRARRARATLMAVA
jgi:hypothetical protein